MERHEVNDKQTRHIVITAAIIAGLIVIALGTYWVLKGDKGKDVKEEGQIVQPPALRRMANLPPTKETAVPEPSYPTDAPVLEQVRKALREGLDPTGAVAMAKSLPDRPERADAAFLLLEYAAESGNAEAAFSVGRIYDPAYKCPSGTIRKNPVTAYEWYTQAVAGGQEKAEARLAGLRRWAEKRAIEGSGEAQALLDAWQ